MKHILPIKTPKISCYNQHANLLAIISQSEAYLPWFYNNYFQLQFTNDIFDESVGARLDFEMPLLFDGCPYIERQSMGRIFIDRYWKKVSSFLRECIDNGYYVYITIDVFYVDGYHDFQKEHGEHPILIFGYDSTDNTFWTADNFFNGQYATRKIEAEQIEKGYHIFAFYDRDAYMDGVTLFKYKNRNQFWNWKHDYVFDKKFMKNSVMCFINSVGLNDYGIIGIEQWKGTTLVYGRNCYEGINVYLDCMPYYDGRLFYVLWEHKKTMVDRIEYMTLNKLIEADNQMCQIFKTIEHKANVIGKLWIKYGVTKNPEVLRRVKILFNDLVNMEEDAFQCFLIA